MSQSTVPNRMSIPQILHLNQAGGVLYSVPNYPTKDLLVDTPEAQHLASLWDDYNKAKQSLDLKIAELTETL